MTDRENIIRRWVRLRQASKAVRVTDTAPDGAGARARSIEVQAAADPPFDLASLPSIEEIAADTDVVAFLRSEVPIELTRAALRRAWVSDPAIRDFIGIADNQWDFNDPDAIPGFGPLTAGENSADAVAQILGRLEQVVSDVTSSGDLASSEAALLEPPAAVVRLADSIDDDISPDQVQEANREQDENWRLKNNDVAHKRRRHGGALPG